MRAYGKVFLVSGYAALGLLALSVSFFFSFATSASIMAVTTTQLIAVIVMVTVFELGKISCPVAQRALKSAGVSHPILAFVIPFALHPILITLSAFSTIFLITSVTSLPNAEFVRANDLTSAVTTFENKFSILKEEYAGELRGINNHTDSSLNNIERIHGGNIIHLRNLIDKETDNTVNGEFVGKRYLSFQERRIRAIEQYEKDRDNIYITQTEEVNQARNSNNHKRDELRRSHLVSINTIRHNSYSDDPRAQHPGLYKFVKSIDSIFDTTLMAISVAWIFAVSVALIIEMIILVISHHFSGMCALWICKWQSTAKLHKNTESIRADLKALQEANSLKKQLITEQMKSTLFEVTDINSTTNRGNEHATTRNSKPTGYTRRAGSRRDKS